tara:strand:+ start:184 stop:1551 length:1368 start_codon:yes stop_codon:yes gene_type:complete
MSSINPVGRSMNGIKTIETASLIFTDDNSSLNTSAGIVSAQANSTTALNGKINSVGFNTSNGVLTLTKEDGTTLTKDLDGRYLTSLDADDIPNLPASKITSGEFATQRIPALPASQINSGTFATTRIPDLDAGKIASGTLATQRIPTLPASQINSGTFTTGLIPALPYVSVGTAQAHTDETIYGVKTFNEPPICSTAPTSNNQLANRAYVLATATSGSGDAVLSNGTATSPQTFTQFNKFNQVVDAPAVPTSNNHLTNKTYVDVEILKSTPITSYENQFSQSFSYAVIRGNPFLAFNAQGDNYGGRMDDALNADVIIPTNRSGKVLATFNITGEWTSNEQYDKGVILGRATKQANGSYIYDKLIRATATSSNGLFISNFMISFQLNADSTLESCVGIIVDDDGLVSGNTYRYTPILVNTNCCNNSTFKLNRVGNNSGSKQYERSISTITASLIIV